MRVLQLSHLIVITTIFLSGCSFVADLTDFHSNSSAHKKENNLLDNGVNKLPSPEPVLTEAVRVEVRNYQIPSRVRGLNVELERRREFESSIAAVFEEEGVPLELMNVAHLESGFRPSVRSPAGAVGLWQLMAPTARSYGLVVNSRNDQRLDPAASSRAASRYLRDLYLKFNDWYLALAAYNSGSARVDSALQRSGGDSFWDLVETDRNGKTYLPTETVKFVTRFIALTIYLSSQGNQEGLLARSTASAPSARPMESVIR